MSRYNEQHATTMLNALQGTDTLAEYRRKIRADAIDEFIKAMERHQQENWIDNLEYGITFADLEEVAEQLKGEKE